MKNLAILLLLTCSAAVAQDTALSEQAKARIVLNFNAAKLAHLNGEYHRAAALFTDTYRLSGNKTLIFNIAQAYRLAGELEKAKEHYLQFIESYEGDEASQLLDEARTHLANVSVMQEQKRQLQEKERADYEDTLRRVESWRALYEAARQDSLRQAHLSIYKNLRSKK